MTNSNDNGLHAVLALLSEIRTTQLDQAKDIGAMGSDIASLAGPTGRVTSLESSNTRQWWLISAITPALLIAHSFARKFGVDV